MNKKKISLIVGVLVILVLLIAFLAIIYRPIHICKSVLPYAEPNYCVAISSKLPTIRREYKLKYSLLDGKTLEQIFVNIRDFQGDTDSKRIEEFTSPEILGNIDRRNAKIDELVTKFIAGVEEMLNNAQKETAYHKQNTYSGGWINYDHMFDASISSAREENLRDTIRAARDEGKFPTEMATRMRQFRALGTPYCEIDSLGTITDCEGNHVGTVKGVFKPLGTQNGANEALEDEKSIITKAINEYKKEIIKESAKAMGVSIKCAKDYEDILQAEGTLTPETLPCSEKENQAIKESWKKSEAEAANSGYGLDNEPIYGNSGMPKSLVLQGVPIMCFEKANMRDNSKCSSKQLKTIQEFFDKNKNIDWSKEYFNY